MKNTAYNQFIQDLKKDSDFIEFKNKATTNSEGYFISYGVVVVRTNRFHNHPSGNLKPSRADEELTNKIKNAAAYFDEGIL